MRRVTTFCVLVACILLLVHGARSEQAFCRNAREIPNIIETDAAKFKQKDNSLKQLQNDCLKEKKNGGESEVDMYISGNEQDPIMTPPALNTIKPEKLRRRRVVRRDTTRTLAGKRTSRLSMREIRLTRRDTIRRRSVVRVTRETRRVRRNRRERATINRQHLHAKTSRRESRNAAPPQQRSAVINSRRIDLISRRIKENRRTRISRVRRSTTTEHTRRDHRKLIRTQRREIRRQFRRNNSCLFIRSFRSRDRITRRSRNARSYRRIENDPFSAQESQSEQRDLHEENTVDNEEQGLENVKSVDIFVKAVTKRNVRRTSVRRNNRDKSQIRMSREMIRSSGRLSMPGRRVQLIRNKQPNTRRSRRRETVQLTRHISTVRQSRRSRDVRARRSVSEKRSQPHVISTFSGSRRVNPGRSGTRSTNRRQRRSRRENGVENRHRITVIHSRRRREHREYSNRRNTRNVRRLTNRIDENHFGHSDSFTLEAVSASHISRVVRTTRSGRRHQRRNLLENRIPSRRQNYGHSIKTKICDIDLLDGENNFNTNQSDTLEKLGPIILHSRTDQSYGTSETASDMMESSATKTEHNDIIFEHANMYRNRVDICEPKNIIRGLVLGFLALLGTRMPSGSSYSPFCHRGFNLRLLSF